MVEPAAPWPARFFVVDAVNNAADVKMFQSECIAERAQHRRAKALRHIRRVNVSRVASAFKVASAFRRKKAAGIELPAEAGSHI